MNFEGFHGQRFIEEAGVRRRMLVETEERTSED